MSFKATALATFLAVFSSASCAYGACLKVYDGSLHVAGASWSEPKGSASFISQADASGRAFLALKASWKEGQWAGAGWNWHSWDGPGDDASSYDALKISLSSRGAKLKDLGVSLVDKSGAKGSSAMLSAWGLPQGPGEGFSEVSIPLSALQGRCDLRSVWEVDFSISPESPKEGECEIRIAKIEFVSEPKEPLKLDGFGISELNPTIPGGREWRCKWDDGFPREIAAVERDPRDPEFLMKGIGKIEIDGKGVAKLSGECPRMYVNDPGSGKPKWLNVEITFYAKRVAESSDSIDYRGFVAQARTEHQDAEERPNLGAGYYGKMTYDGRMIFQKELIHKSGAGYSVNKPLDGVRRFWGHGSGEMPKGVWIGFKLLVRSVDSGGHVQLELLRDMEDGAGGGDWERVAFYKDEGGWTNPSLTDAMLEEFYAPGEFKRDQILTRPGSSVYIRNDGILEGDYKRFSVREIAPLP